MVSWVVISYTLMVVANLDSTFQLLALMAIVRSLHGDKRCIRAGMPEMKGFSAIRGK